MLSARVIYAKCFCLCDSNVMYDENKNTVHVNVLILLGHFLCCGVEQWIKAVTTPVTEHPKLSDIGHDVSLEGVS